MQTAGKRQLAHQLYNSGYALLQENRYEQALRDLRRAEDLLRKLDARGHPFNYVLSNGVSGLSNALFLQGRCHQALGDVSRAVACYETSLINAKFERAKPFRAFEKEVLENLAVCYEETARKAGAPPQERLTADTPPVDTSFLFPFSLDPAYIPFARLYEIAPERHAHLRDWYERAKKKDGQFRRIGDTTDESIMRRISITVWGTLVIVWVVYGVIVVKALTHHK
jgi:tetratricopeptide (TPR) repeat protein